MKSSFAPCRSACRWHRTGRPRRHLRWHRAGTHGGCARHRWGLTQGLHPWRQRRRWRGPCHGQIRATRRSERWDACSSFGTRQTGRPFLRKERWSGHRRLRRRWRRRCCLWRVLWRRQWHRRLLRRWLATLKSHVVLPDLALQEVTTHQASPNLELAELHHSGDSTSDDLEHEQCYANAEDACVQPVLLLHSLELGAVCEIEDHLTCNGSTGCDVGRHQSHLIHPLWRYPANILSLLLQDLRMRFRRPIDVSKPHPPDKGRIIFPGRRWWRRWRCWHALRASLSRQRRHSA